MGMISDKLNGLGFFIYACGPTHCEYIQRQPCVIPSGVPGTWDEGDGKIVIYPEDGLVRVVRRCWMTREQREALRVLLVEQLNLKRGAYVPFRGYRGFWAMTAYRLPGEYKYYWDLCEEMCRATR